MSAPETLKERAVYITRGITEITEELKTLKINKNYASSDIRKLLLEIPNIESEVLAFKENVQTNIYHIKEILKVRRDEIDKIRFFNEDVENKYGCLDVKDNKRQLSEPLILNSSFENNYLSRQSNLETSVFDNVECKIFDEKSASQVKKSVDLNENSYKHCLTSLSDLLNKSLPKI